jgi:hypothetical protein
MKLTSFFIFCAVICVIFTSQSVAEDNELQVKLKLIEKEPTKLIKKAPVKKKHQTGKVSQFSFTGGAVCFINVALSFLVFLSEAYSPVFLSSYLLSLS